MGTKESVFDGWKEGIKRDIDRCKTLEELKGVIDDNQEWVVEEIREEEERKKNK